MSMLKTSHDQSLQEIVKKDFSRAVDAQSITHKILQNDPPVDKVHMVKTALEKKLDR